MHLAKSGYKETHVWCFCGRCIMGKNGTEPGETSSRLTGNNDFKVTEERGTDSRSKEEDPWLR
ncbi:hypothetical protein EYF80_031531 [Liparis tanakae]|uniref:Uncharacterized protein n=1 Tax=Liparis tanakae TaxID=230148 RepID=A0A4Z2GXP8_9TELE|nr:hypothetical protein EYF80_031531 [Liparis tanakae]